jgi:hypothetical protein
MNKSYVIQWKSKVNGRAGRGSRLLDRAEAERLAEELNREYPDIQHEPIPAEPSSAPPHAGSAGEPAEQATHETTTHNTHSLSTR